MKGKSVIIALLCDVIVPNDECFLKIINNLMSLNNNYLSKFCSSFFLLHSAM